MWRTKEGLGSWFTRRRQHRAKRAPLEDRLRLELAERHLSPRVAQVDLAHEKGHVRSFDSNWTESARVIDGLGAFCQISADHITEQLARAKRGTTQGLKIESVGLLDSPLQVKATGLSLNEPATVRTQDWLPKPKVSSLALEVPLSASITVRSSVLLTEPPALSSGPAWFFSSLGAIQDETHKILPVPHLRRSVDMDRIGRSEWNSYLLEAECTKSVSKSDSEFLALFRRVPVELINKVRFDAAKGLLFYTVVLEDNLRRTRVHDLAAVRDRSTGEVHLVPHRTRYRTVFLS